MALTRGRLMVQLALKHQTPSSSSELPEELGKDSKTKVKDWLQRHHEAVSSDFCDDTDKGIILCLIISRKPRKRPSHSTESETQQTSSKIKTFKKPYESIPSSICGSPPAPVLEVFCASTGPSNDGNFKRLTAKTKNSIDLPEDFSFVPNERQEKATGTVYSSAPTPMTVCHENVGKPKGRSNAVNFQR
ncbi:hypothetical protein ElyMa_000585900 [Elysia marginata]|uniref:Uncharacterized protein n=1 Tax=Elysia marginata TaxID=1093978 RepID=A0AAV4G6E2_9GAST|nr:hypothetical protein ElyMa_000585900 [Elysia marginata]